MSVEKQFEMMGIDGKQYGPLTESELRAYVSQGRANSETKIRRVGDESWQPLGDLLRIAAPKVVSQPQQLEAAVPSDTPLEVGLALSEGWQLFKEHAGMLVGAGAIFLGILTAAGLIGAVIPAAQLLVQGPLMGGLILMILKLSREGHAEVGDVFLGFQNYGWLLLVTVVQGAVKRKGEMDLSDPEEMPQDAPEPEPFDVEGQLTWDGDVPVLKFDFDIEQELKSDEFKGITVEVSAEGTIVAHGERLVIEKPVLAIAPIDGGGLRLSWEPGDCVLEAATEVTFAEPKIIELDEGQAEYLAKPSGDRPQRFYRLRSR